MIVELVCFFELELMLDPIAGPKDKTTPIDHKAWICLRFDQKDADGFEDNFPAILLVLLYGTFTLTMISKHLSVYLMTIPSKPMRVSFLQSMTLIMEPWKSDLRTFNYFDSWLGLIKCICTIFIWDSKYTGSIGYEAAGRARMSNWARSYSHSSCSSCFRLTWLLTACCSSLTAPLWFSIGHPSLSSALTLYECWCTNKLFVAPMLARTGRREKTWDGGIVEPAHQELLIFDLLVELVVVLGSA